MHQKRKRSLLLLALILALCTLGCGPPPDPGEEPGGSTSPTTAAKAWWRGLSQVERNQAILDRAARDIDRYVDQECKEWVRSVVLEASRGSVNIPPTCPNEVGWYWCAGSGAVGVSTPINNVQPGWIVQMRRRQANGAYGPHTAIVVGRSPTSVTWIDSNFYQPRVVKVHTESLADFERATCVNGGCYYSAYVIGGN